MKKWIPGFLLIALVATGCVPLIPFAESPRYTQNTSAAAPVSLAPKASTEVAGRCYETGPRPADGWHAYVKPSQRKARSSAEFIRIIETNDQRILDVDAWVIMRQIACITGRGEWESLKAFAEWLRSLEVRACSGVNEYLGHDRRGHYNDNFARACDKGEWHFIYEGRGIISSTCFNPMPPQRGLPATKKAVQATPVASAVPQVARTVTAAPAAAPPKPPASIWGNYLELRPMLFKQAPLSCNSADSRATVPQLKDMLKNGAIELYHPQQPLLMTIKNVAAPAGTDVTFRIHGVMTVFKIGNDRSVSIPVLEKSGESGLGVPYGLINKDTVVVVTGQGETFFYPDDSCQEPMHTMPGELLAAVGKGHDFMTLAFSKQKMN